MQQQEMRPAYVSFQMRPVENRTKSLQAGHAVYDQEPWIIVTPQGSKDRLERDAKSWFEQKARDVYEGRFPAEWLEHYRKMYNAWLQNESIPESGLPIKNWPMANPAQVQTLLGINIRTVEDLAVANEETILRLGMGGRQLKQAAITFLDQAKGNGSVVRRLTAAEEELETLRRRNEFLEQQLASPVVQAALSAGHHEAAVPVGQASPTRPAGEISASDILGDDSQDFKLV